MQDLVFIPHRSDTAGFSNNRNNYLDNKNNQKFWHPHSCFGGMQMPIRLPYFSLATLRLSVGQKRRLT